MKVKFVFFCLVLLFQSNFVEAQKKRPTPAAKTLTAREIANKVLPSVVLVITQDENGNPISQGSGFVFGAGLVVSNLHVFERATNAIVKNVKTGEVSKAIEVVAMNAKEDICVIRIDNTKFSTLSLGDSSLIQTGDEIYVASNPKGLEGSFTKGIVSSLRSDVGLFQIDAAISFGSSGGVLLNQKAEAVGIIKSSLVSGQNLNFAIPINKLKVLPHSFKHSIQLAGACAYRDKDKAKLKGLVKSVTEKKRFTTIENGKFIETNPLINSIITYDLDGNKIEDQLNSFKGEFIIKFIYTFDENRLVKSQKQLQEDEAILDEMSKITGSPTKENFSKRLLFNLQKSIDWKLRTKGFSETRKTDEQGGTQSFDGYGNMTTWFIKGTEQIYEYDSEGRVKEKTQVRDGEMQIRTRYRYKDDKHSNWIEQSEYNNFPGNTELDSNEWYQGITVYREITYYE